MCAVPPFHTYAVTPVRGTPPLQLAPSNQSATVPGAAVHCVSCAHAVALESPMPAQAALSHLLNRARVRKRRDWSSLFMNDPRCVVRPSAELIPRPQLSPGLTRVQRKSGDSLRPAILHQCPWPASAEIGMPFSPLRSVPLQ